MQTLNKNTAIPVPLDNTKQSLTEYILNQIICTFAVTIQKEITYARDVWALHEIFILLDYNVIQSYKVGSFEI